MDVFRLDENGRQGQIINGFDSLVWTERYLTNGEFKMSAPFTPQIRDQVPIGSFISHFGTKEICEVMDHEIIKPKGKTPTFVATGDTIETFLSQRPAIPNHNGGERDRFTNEPNSYILSEANSWDQAFRLIRRHLTGPSPAPVMAGDWVPQFQAVSEIVGTETPQLSRIIERGTVYERVLELLAIADCGIKIRRPTGPQTYIQFVIHKGKDVSGTVIFSASLGELEEAGYFWSNRRNKNAAFTEGKYTGITSDFTGPDLLPRGLNRRWIRVDATDIEDDSDVDAYDQQLYAREQQALAVNNMVELTNLKLSDDTTIQYNKDYFIGDIVGVAADFGVRTKLRVDEFTWAFDKTGVSGYPTLKLPISQG